MPSLVCGVEEYLQNKSTLTGGVPTRDSQILKLVEALRTIEEREIKRA